MSGTISAKLFILSCLLLLTTSHLCAADLAPAPVNQKEKESYSIGYQVGLSIKSDGIDVDFEKLIQGLQTGIDGKEPLPSQEEIRNLIVNLTKKKRETEMRKIQERIVKNAEESEKFLEENRKKVGVKTTESGLQYKILKEGDGNLPKLEDVLSVRRLESGTAVGRPSHCKTVTFIAGHHVEVPFDLADATGHGPAELAEKILGQGVGGSGRGGDEQRGPDQGPNAQIDPFPAKHG